MLDFPLDTEPSRMLTDYLEHARARFPGAGTTDRLWAGMRGPMTRYGFRLIAKRHTHVWFGQAHTPHVFRKWFRASAARRSPELAMDAADIMGHTAEVSMQHYSEASGLHAALRHGERLAKRRARHAGRSAAPARRSAPQPERAVPGLWTAGTGCARLGLSSAMLRTVDVIVSLPAKGITMKVYLDDAGEKRLLGRADVPEDVGAIYEMPLFGAASTIIERFTIGSVTHLPERGGAPVVERVVVLSMDQRPEILPGWQPLAS